MAKKKHWLEVSSKVKNESQTGVSSATFKLDELAEKEAIDPEKFKEFKRRTKLETFYWRTYWHGKTLQAAGGRAKLQKKASLIVVFLHGWDGSGAIWEDLPGDACATQPGALVLVPDVNGFSRSPFKYPDLLEYEDCDPAANMRAVEMWLRLLGFADEGVKTPIMLVGHSMSGAALFYLNERAWSGRRLFRLALAPALLANDASRKSFYRSMGVGIRYTGQLNRLVDYLSNTIITQLIPGASKAVQAEHERVFKATDKQTTARTFFAMGQGKRPRHGKTWRRFRVLAGHDDRLVGLGSILPLLAEMGFGSRQVRVLLGDHYFFSVGRISAKLHRPNREIVQNEIRATMERALRPPKPKDSKSGNKKK